VRASVSGITVWDDRPGPRNAYSGNSFDETLSMALHSLVEASASDITIHDDAPRGNTSVILQERRDRSPPRDRHSSSSREVTVSSPDVLPHDSALRRTRRRKARMRRSQNDFTECLYPRPRSSPEHTSLVSTLSQTTCSNRTQTQSSTPGYLHAQTREWAAG
jgi:hypothetical protein